MDRGDIERVKHIKRYCEDITAAIVRFGNTFDIFQQDIDFYNSVSMSIMQIGELAVGLSQEFQDATLEQMPWGLIKGMRNRFAHSYATMDRSDIWETAVADIPILMRFCDSILGDV